MAEYSYITSGHHRLYKSTIDVFNEKADTFPDKEIFIHCFPNGSRRAITYNELRHKAGNVAKFLVSTGVQVGDSVGIMGPNSIEWVIGEVAILMTGATAVNLMKPPGSFKETLKALQFSDSTAIIVDPDGDDSFINDIKLYWKTGKTAADRLENPVIVLLKKCDGCDVPDVETLGNDAKNDVQLPASIFPETTAIVFMTSGSTGNPKLVEHSHVSLVNNPLAFLRSMGADMMKSAGAVYDDKPFSWMGGTIIFCLLNGNARVFRNWRQPAKGNGVLDIWRIVVEEKCTNAILQQFTILDLLENEEEIMKSNYFLNTIITGGQMIDSQIANAHGKICNKVVAVFASTELSPVAVVEVEGSMVVGNLGSLLDGVEVKIVDECSSTLARERLREICVKSPWMLKGYRKASTKHRHALSNGWLKTGDIGIIDLKGNLIFKGKSESVIKRFTLKIFSGDVEECIANIPGVRGVVVVAVPDTRANEEVCACLVLDQNSGLTMDEVTSRCREKLGDNITGDAPTYYLQFDAIPTLATGKPDRIKVKRDALEILNINIKQ